MMSYGFIVLGFGLNNRKLLKQNEYILSKQLLKSGTSIGANVEESLAGQSRADFLSKMSKLLKKQGKQNIG